MHGAHSAACARFVEPSCSPLVWWRIAMQLSTSVAGLVHRYAQCRNGMRSVPESRLSALGRDGAVVGVAMLATTATTLPVFLIGALAPVLEVAVHLDALAEGAAVGAFFLASMAGALGVARAPWHAPGGILAAGGSVASALGSYAIALFARGPLVVVAGALLAGVGNGVLQPGVNDLVATLVTPKRQGLAFGVKQAAIPTATLLAGLALPLLGVRGDWRRAYEVAGALAALVTVVALTMPRSHEATLRARTRFHAPAALWVSALAVALGAGAANALGSFGVVSLVHDHLAPGPAGYAAAAASAVGLGARLVVGRLADTRLRRPLRVVAAMMAVGALGELALASGLVPLLLAGLFVGYGAGWGWNGLITYAVGTRWRSDAAQATAVAQAGAFAGSVLGPLGVGTMIHLVGFPLSWVVVSALALAAASLMAIVAPRFELTS